MARVLGRIFALTVALCLIVSLASANSLQGQIRLWNVDHRGNGAFNTIQEAIDAASDGDIISVSEGIYYERLVVNKTLTIEGANSDTTVLDASVPYNFGVNENGTALEVVSCSISFSGFTVRNALYGLEIHSDNNTVLGNKIINCSGGGIVLDGSGCLIANNTFLDDFTGVWTQTNSSIFSGNVFMRVFAGIRMENSSTGNLINSNNFFWLYNDAFELYGENSYPSSNIITNNTISPFFQPHGYEGTLFVIDSTYNNSIYRNNFLFYSETYPGWYVFRSSNNWDNGKVGNYWADFNGTSSTNGIWNQPFRLGDVIDNFPLSRPIEDLPDLIAPVAVAQISPSIAVDNQTIWVNASNSYDNWGIARCEWDFGDNSTESTSTEFATNHTFVLDQPHYDYQSDEYIYNITLRVWDFKDNLNTTQTPVIILMNRGIKPAATDNYQTYFFVTLAAAATIIATIMLIFMRSLRKSKRVTPKP